MNAAILTGLRKIVVREVPEPRIAGPRDVLLRVDAVGVCGSDIHYYRHGRVGSQVVTYPYRVGHEMSATVLETGRAVRRVRPGDRVAVDPAAWCGRCDQCRAGRFHTCRNLKFLGTPGQGDGCLCERIVMPAASCFPLRTSTTAEDGALVEPLSIGIYSVSLAGGVAGKKIAILGCGPIGLCVLLAAREAGARRVYATDKIASRLAVARRQGASWAGNPDRADIVRQIARREPLSLDIVFECCGKSEALDQAVNLLKPGGTLVIVGIPATDTITLSIDKLRRKEITIRNVRRQNECVEPAVHFIEKHRREARFLVTHRFPLAESKKAFDLVSGYRDGVLKAMILPNG
ncbi:MAG: alcohol dehydrogenase catalytic domain-containing protein [Planctomycetota bacterium]